VQSGVPDHFTSRIGLPDLNGHDVIRAIRATSHASAVFAIALTGYAQLQDREQALGAGFDGHLAKPPPLEDLNELLAVAQAKKG
jgi:two-component system, sensor histidine kinase